MNSENAGLRPKTIFDLVDSPMAGPWVRHVVEAIDDRQEVINRTTHEYNEHMAGSSLESQARKKLQIIHAIDDLGEEAVLLKATRNDQKATEVDATTALIPALLHADLIGTVANSHEADNLLDVFRSVTVDDIELILDWQRLGYVSHGFGLVHCILGMTHDRIDDIYAGSMFMSIYNQMRFLDIDIPTPELHSDPTALLVATLTHLSPLSQIDLDFRLMPLTRLVQESDDPSSDLERILESLGGRPFYDEPPAPCPFRDAALTRLLHNYRSSRNNVYLELAKGVAENPLVVAKEPTVSEWRDLAYVNHEWGVLTQDLTSLRTANFGQRHVLQIEEEAGRPTNLHDRSQAIISGWAIAMAEHYAEGDIDWLDPVADLLPSIQDEDLLGYNSNALRVCAFRWIMSLGSWPDIDERTWCRGLAWLSIADLADDSKTPADSESIVLLHEARDPRFLPTDRHIENLEGMLRFWQKQVGNMGAAMQVVRRLYRDDMTDRDEVRSRLTKSLMAYIGDVMLLRKEAPLVVMYTFETIVELFSEFAESELSTLVEADPEMVRLAFCYVSASYHIATAQGESEFEAWTHLARASSYLNRLAVQVAESGRGELAAELVLQITGMLVSSRQWYAEKETGRLTGPPEQALPIRQGLTVLAASSGKVAVLVFDSSWTLSATCLQTEVVSEDEEPSAIETDAAFLPVLVSRLCRDVTRLGDCAGWLEAEARGPDVVIPGSWASNLPFGYLAKSRATVPVVMEGLRHHSAFDRLAEGGVNFDRVCYMLGDWDGGAQGEVDVESDLAILRSFFGQRVVAVESFGDLEAVCRESDSVLLHYVGHYSWLGERAAVPALGQKPTELDELGRLDLRGIRCVVLGACGSAALSPKLPGQLDSVAGAFVEASVDGVLGSMWQLYDKPAAIFFESLYASVSAGSSILDAYRTALLSLCDGHAEGQHAFTNPLYWAGWRLYCGGTFGGPATPSEPQPQEALWGEQESAPRAYRPD